MNIKYLSMLSAIMLVGSGFVSAMESDSNSMGFTNIQDEKTMDIKQDSGFQQKSEYGTIIKGKTKLPGKKNKNGDQSKKECKKALEKCQKYNDCEDLKDCSEEFGWKDYGDGKVGFSQEVVGNPKLDEPKERTIHGKPNPYRKFDKTDLKATYYGESETIGLDQDDLFASVPEMEKQPIEQELDYSTGGNGIYDA